VRAPHQSLILREVQRDVRLRHQKDPARLAGRFVELITHRPAPLVDSQVIRIDAVFLSAPGLQGAAARGVRRGVGDDLPELFRRLSRRGGYALRVIPEAKAEGGLVPCVGVAPGANLIAPEFHVLLAGQTLGLVGSEDQRLGPVGPYQFGFLVERTLTTSRQMARMPDSLRS